MRWDEYVEEATEAIPGARTAREVRRELRDHLESATEDLCASGLEREAAEIEAMRRLGPAEVLAEQFRSHYRPWAPVWPAAVTAAGLVAALATVGLRAWSMGAAVLLLAWTAVWALSHARSFGAAWRRPWTLPPRDALAARVDAAWPFVGAGAVAATCIVFGPWALNTLGPLGFLLAIAACAATWYAAVLRTDPDDEDIVFPFGSGLATATLVVLASLAESAIGAASRIAYILVIAALYFSATNALTWLRSQRRRSEAAQRLPVVVEDPGA